MENVRELQVTNECEEERQITKTNTGGEDNNKSHKVRLNWNGCRNGGRFAVKYDSIERFDY